ncbi:MAG: hypothetical protein AAB869_01490, partial [Patescibacteria group bacterium]
KTPAPSEIEGIKKPTQQNNFLENYASGHQQVHSNGLPDFNEGENLHLTRSFSTAIYYENFRIRAIEFLKIKITHSMLKKMVKVSTTVILGTIAMIILGISKAGSIIRNWFQRMITDLSRMG